MPQPSEPKPVICALCKVQECHKPAEEADLPAYCPMVHSQDVLQAARDEYDKPDTRAFAQAAARTEADRYPLETRVEETMSFARRIGATHLGIATCIGFIQEARILCEILRSHGLKVSSVCCKVGSVPKEEIGLSEADKIHPCHYEAMCNPVAQAKLLNSAGTDLNVLVVEWSSGEHAVGKDV